MDAAAVERSVKAGLAVWRSSAQLVLVQRTLRASLVYYDTLVSEPPVPDNAMERAIGIGLAVWGSRFQEPLVRRALHTALAYYETTSRVAPAVHSASSDDNHRDSGSDDTPLQDRLIRALRRLVAANTAPALTLDERKAALAAAEGLLRELTREV